MWIFYRLQSARSRAAQSPRKRDVYSQYQYVPDVLRRSTLPYRSEENGKQENRDQRSALYTSPEAVETEIEVNSLVNHSEKDTTMLYQNYNGEAIAT